ncbi:hypothetical protein MHZ95_01520 [Sporosarcina sp. ACRSM]|uniref:hypothetical protein n=1 Tax=Sporosarcina sp. ACRSM TaxID=2918216 RepID=UPI001EF6C05C|nr:hypothetical protein [Sporosarcina sp. ACRSM]MCG7333951.1 hypothetical protein [Sporosarcina sp. ACRSM]
MSKQNQNSTNQNASQKKRRNSGMKEEISIELAEIGNVTPNHEPMTPNQREKSEAEKWYP